MFYLQDMKEMKDDSNSIESYLLSPIFTLFFSSGRGEQQGACIWEGLHISIQIKGKMYLVLRDF